MKLSIKDRIVIMDCLPAQGNLTDYRTLHQLRMKLALTDEEREAAGFKVVPSPDGKGQSFAWETDVVKDVDIAGHTQKLVCESLKRLDTEGRVNDQNISLFEKFGME